MTEKVALADSRKRKSESKKTIKDFGEQWTIYQTNDGFYASQELFSDIVGPLIGYSDIKEKRVLDIGSGTGRIVMMLLEAGAEQVFGVEPSDAYHVLCKNVGKSGLKAVGRTTLLHCRGDEIKYDHEIDYAFSIGVIHHIPEPDAVVKAAYQALKPGGKFVVWLYGKEGNEVYLRFVEPIREVTKRLPHKVLVGIVWILYYALCMYARLCKWFRLPLREYLINVLFRFTPDKRRLVIYDQLNPSYAKYYSKCEVEGLMRRGGFVNTKLYHRHGYSWTAVGEKS